MEFYEILIIVACVVIVLGTIITSILNKKQGKTSCGCNCASCKGCSHHNTKNPVEEKSVTESQVEDKSN